MPDSLVALEFGLPLCLFVGTAVFAYAGIELFSRGWDSYEQRYAEGAEKSLSAMYLTMRPQHLLYLAVLGFFFLGGIGLLLFSRWSVGFACGAFGFWLPRIVIALMKRRRDADFRRQLPGTIDAVSRGLKSGLSLGQCFDLIEREMPDPMKQEFRVVNRQMQLGMSAVEALDRLLERMQSDDLDLVVTAVHTSYELGGNLTEVLENISGTIRERFTLQGKLRTLTSQGRLQAGVLAGVPLLLFFALQTVNPKLVEPMITTPAGWAMLAGAALWELIGVFFIWKIVAVKV